MWEEGGWVLTILDDREMWWDNALKTLDVKSQGNREILMKNLTKRLPKIEFESEWG